MPRKQPIRKLSVIFPYYHESATNLLTAIERVSSFLQSRNIPYEIIISQNGPYKKIKPIFPNTKTVHDEKKGLGRAIRNALDIATGDHYYITSLELPFNFTDLKQMLNEHHNYNLIIGSKLHSKSTYKIRPLRSTLTNGVSLVTRLLLPRFTIKDPNGTLFGDVQKLKKIITQVKDNSFFFSSELIYLCIKNGLKIKEVPVTYIKTDGQSSINVMDGIKYLAHLFKLSFREFVGKE